jgi:hypothetical protein
MSVPTVDEDAWRTLEPGTAHPLQRLRAVRELTAIDRVLDEYETLVRQMTEKSAE